MWLFDAVSKVCESTDAGNQGDQQTTAEMQEVDLSHYLINKAGWQRHMGTHQPQSIPVSTGTQGHRLLQAQLIPAGCECVWAPACPTASKGSWLCTWSQGCAFMVSELLISLSLSPSGGLSVCVSVYLYTRILFLKTGRGWTTPGIVPGVSPLWHF